MQLKAESPIPMSPGRFSLTLTHLAKEDFQDILIYAEQTWGAKQANSYAEMLDTALQSLQSVPEKGSNLEGTAYLFVRAGKHRIFYGVYGSEVRVVRILHGRMDFETHLTDKA